MQEIQPAPPVPVDPQQYQQFPQSDLPVPQSFVSLVPAPHPDPSLPPDSASHMHVPMPPPLFQQSMEPSGISMHLPISSLPPAPDASNAMDVVHPVSSQSGSPGVIPDLSTQSAMYGMDPRLAGLEAVDPSHPLLSSPSANSASTSASHASSPSLTGVTPSYSAGSSSLASALDHVGTTRSRSGSVASPPNLTASGSDMGFPSAGSGPPTTVHESGFQFPPPGFEDPMQTSNEPVQDVPGGAHLMVLGDMLKKCVSSFCSFDIAIETACPSPCLSVASPGLQTPAVKRAPWVRVVARPRSFLCSRKMYSLSLNSLRPCSWATQQPLGLRVTPLAQDLHRHSA